MVQYVYGQQPKRRGRPPKPTPYIRQLLEQFSAELHDAEHGPSNVAQAMRVYRASGLSEEEFVARLYAARAITKRRGNIRTAANNGQGLPGLKNKMPYYFAVLRDLLGMGQEEAAEGSPGLAASP